TNTLVIVIDYKYYTAVVLRQFYHDMGSLGMLFYIVECFPVNLENLPAHAVRGAQLGRIDEQVQGNGGFVAIALSESAHEIHEIGALDAQGTQVGDGLTEFGGLVSNGLLKIRKGAGGLFRGCGNPAAEDVQLDFDAEESLENAIV